MFKSFKMLMAVAPLVGFLLLSLGDYAHAGTPGPGASECVDYCKQISYFAQYNNCVDDCSYLTRKDKGQCIMGCKMNVACDFDSCLFYVCGLGADEHPAFCNLW